MIGGERGSVLGLGLAIDRGWFELMGVRGEGEL